MIRKFPTKSRKKEIFFVLISIAIGVLAALLITELGYRLFLFGFKLHYQDNRIIDKTFFAKDKKHIFFVGDSFTQGYPFPIDQSYPMVLDKKLKNNKIKITNFAMRGTNLIQQLCIIKQISELCPTLIVWGISTNDLCALENNKIDLRRFDNYQSMIFGTKPRPKINYFKNILYELPKDCLFRCHMSIFSTVKEILNNYSYVYILAKQHLEEKNLLGFLRVKYNERTELQGIAIDSLEFYKNGIDPNRVFA
jgi:hypothetical protein